MLENDKKFTVIKVSEYYPDNCSEHEYAEVSDVILRAYDDFEKYEERQRDWYRRHVNRFVDFDTVLDMKNEAAVVFDEDYYRDEMFFGMLAGRCSEVTYRRARLHYVFGLTISEISGIEEVTFNAVKKSILQATNILKKMYNIKADSH